MSGAIPVEVRRAYLVDTAAGLQVHGSPTRPLMAADRELTAADLAPPAGRFFCALSYGVKPDFSSKG